VRVSEGIYRVDGVRGVNVYVAEIGDGLLVIDTGMPGTAEKIVEFLRTLGRAPSDVRTIAITHADPDHIGGVARLKELTGASVAVHAEDAGVLAGTDAGKRPGRLTAVVFAVIGPMMRINRVQPDVLLQEGDSLAGFSVLHTPGHTAGSMALYRDGVVFSGDALLSDSKGNERPPRKMLSADYPQALESADKIRALGYRVLLPGHGAPVIAAQE
jgi:glyoxylase-like metal-dependent hydrolase (beta-lactamase superfamily II)